MYAGQRRLNLKDIGKPQSSFSAQALSGKTALVTGAGRGIGRAVALSLAACGANLVLLGRRKVNLESLLEQLGPTVAASSIYAVDMAQVDTLETALVAIRQECRDIDILVNNAGIYRTQAVAEHSLEIWKETLDTNLTSCMLTAKVFVPGMVSRSWGRVINISSVSGKCGEAFGAAYSASKFALLGLTQSLALECARAQVTVNAVCPGWVATDMAFDQIEDPKWCSLTELPQGDALELTRLSVPQERFIEPGEVASLVTYLCTEEARGITGQAINVCGGLSIH